MVVLAGRQLERVAIAAGDQHRAATTLFSRGRGGEKIVGLVTGLLGIGEAAGGDELRDNGELFNDLVIEFAAALISRKCFMAVGRLLVGVPADQHGARPFLAVEPQQQVGETENGAGRPVALSANVLRQRVIGAMCKRVAVDHQQWPSARFRLGADRLIVFALAPPRSQYRGRGT